jgi:hypothetical protein
MPKAPITNIVFGTMTLGYRGYGARIHDAATADAMLGTLCQRQVNSRVDWSGRTSRFYPSVFFG